MALFLPEFNSNIGLVLPEAYLAPAFINYNTRDKVLTFDLAVWVNKTAFLSDSDPIETNLGFGTLPLDYDGSQNILSIIDNSILIKIQDVLGKTQADCDAHNAEMVLTADSLEWLAYWDIRYQRFANAILDGVPSTPNPPAENDGAAE